MPYPVDLLYPRQRRRQLDREQSEVGRSTNKPSISRADSLLKMYELMTQGAPYAEAQREVHARFEIAGAQETPASRSLTRQIIRVRGIMNNGGYPIELVPDEIEVTEVLSGSGSPNYLDGASLETPYEIGVDEGMPGSGRTVYSVASKGKIIDTFGITQEGDEFVVKDGEGNELGRCRSEEQFMKILHEASTGLLGEEPPEDTSRFDIIDIE